ncbi:MAG: thioredoxin family protein [Sedimentisphaerales bacterium]|nr:thioredoxin family protein [Sedimentisphaerales bacterium]
MKITRTFRILLLLACIVLTCSSCRKDKGTETTPQKPDESTKESKTPDTSDETTSKQNESTEPSATRQPVDKPVKPAPPIPAKPVQIADNEWTMNFAAAKLKATAEKKDLLINFSGSDWCGWCIRLDGEVFSKDAFKREAGKSFVMVTLDYPNDKSKLSEEVQKQNAALRDVYPIPGFPTVFLTDAKGRPYAQTGYQEGGAEAYLQHLKELKATGDKIEELLVQAEKATDNLEKVKLLDQAMQLLPSSFLSQYYSEMVDQIISLDPENKAGLKDKYLFMKQFGEVEAALEKQDFAKALSTIDAMLSTFKPTGQQAQELNFARAHALHYLQRLDEERKALEAALAAAPDSEMAPMIQRTLQVNFPPPPALAIPAKVTTTMKTYQNYLPERAFDGDTNTTYFWSAGGPKTGDTFTITLDEAKPYQSIWVYTGVAELPQDHLYKGVLEVSGNGTTFEEVATFENGVAEAQLNNKVVKAIQIRCTEDQVRWLVLREVVLK